MPRKPRKPKLAVWKFASCDGCQLSLLDCEDELLAVADAVDIAYFPEATRAVLPGPYDISLVEGSITTAQLLVTIGACATSGGIQALRNFADVADYSRIVYAHPEYLDALATSTPIADHVAVDLELRGCPIDKGQLLATLASLLRGRVPVLPDHSVCEECKRHGNICVTVAHGTPCLGPVTLAGCGALCPRHRRGCYGCFGPAPTANPVALSTRLAELGQSSEQLVRLYRGFNANASTFRDESNRHES